MARLIDLPQWVNNETRLNASNMNELVEAIETIGDALQDANGNGLILDVDTLNVDTYGDVPSSKAGIISELRSIYYTMYRDKNSKTDTSRKNSSDNDSGSIATWLDKNPDSGEDKGGLLARTYQLNNSFIALRSDFIAHTKIYQSDKILYARGSIDASSDILKIAGNQGVLISESITIDNNGNITPAVKDSSSLGTKDKRFNEVYAKAYAGESLSITNINASSIGSDTVPVNKLYGITGYFDTIQLNELVPASESFKVRGSIISTSSDSYDIGSSTNTWRNIYSKKVIAQDIVPNGSGYIGNSSNPFQYIHVYSIYSTQGIYPLAAALSIFGGLSVDGNIVPQSDTTYSLGDSVDRWSKIYAMDGSFAGEIESNKLSSSEIYQTGAQLTSDDAIVKYKTYNDTKTNLETRITPLEAAIDNIKAVNNTVSFIPQSDITSSPNYSSPCKLKPGNNLYVSDSTQESLYIVLAAESAGCECVFNFNLAANLGYIEVEANTGDSSTQGSVKCTYYYNIRYINEEGFTTNTTGVKKDVNYISVVPTDGISGRVSGTVKVVDMYQSNGYVYVEANYSRNENV